MSCRTRRVSEDDRGLRRCVCVTHGTGVSGTREKCKCKSFATRSGSDGDESMIPRRSSKFCYASVTHDAVTRSETKQGHI